MADQFLIVSDVDGTLLGDDAALRAFAEWIEPRRDSVRLAYSSGRFAHSVAASIRATPLPEPDAIIGGVGTQIVEWPADRPLDGWPVLAGRWDADAVREALIGQAGLELQPELFLSDYKISFFAYDATPRQLRRWQRRLEAAALAVQLVYSSGRDLDVLPAGISKGAAAAFLAQRWKTPPTQVIVCGDSGNDLSMFQLGYRGVVVGNALAELRAHQGPVVHHSRGSYAAGVLEGVQHWLACSESFVAASISNGSTATGRAAQTPG